MNSFAYLLRFAKCAAALEKIFSAGAVMTESTLMRGIPVVQSTKKRCRQPWK